MNRAYQKSIEDLISNMPKDIIDTSLSRSRGRVPTQASSAFLTNRQQGDWAETLVQQLVNRVNSKILAVKYGRTDNIIAGDPKFPAFYESYQDELDSIGKKPDLLVFEKSNYDGKLGLDISHIECERLDKIAASASAALEIRSSAFLIQKYNEYLKTKPKRSTRRTFLSFTPKVEDIMVIYKWISIFGVRHFYVQVFFDAIYMISFQKILEIMADTSNKNRLFTIEKHSKNQFKWTIHVNIQEGICLADEMQKPQHSSSFRELNRGRLLYYVKFREGTASFKTEEFLKELQL